MKKLGQLMAVVMIASMRLFSASDEINLYGTVSDQDGNPLQGVEVYLTNQEPSDTTDAEGKYILSGIVSGVRNIAPETKYVLPVIKGNSLCFTIRNVGSVVGIDIISLAGRCIRKVMRDFNSNQNYSIPLPIDGLPPSIYIVSARIGSDHSVQRILVQENGIVQKCEKTSKTIYSMSKKAASDNMDGIDILHFQKNKFTPVDTPITSYVGKYDITMIVEDTLPPVITVINDSTSFAFQDSALWRVYWNEDSIPKHRTIEDNSGTFWTQGITSTQIFYDRAGFVSITYSAHDQMYNLGKAQRLIILYDSTVHDDKTPPLLTVNPDTMRFTKGDIFNQWEGVSARDDVDSAIVLVPDWVKVTDNIQSEQPRNQLYIYMDIVGTYTITYTTMDTHKNTVSKSRTLIVSEP